MNNKQNKWTTEQEAFLLIKRQDGVGYREISQLMESKFSVKRNESSLAQKVSNLNKAKPSRKPISWNKDKVDFVFSCLWNGLTMDKIKAAFSEQYDYELSTTQLKNCLAKKKPSAKVQAVAESILQKETPKVTLNGLIETEKPVKETTKPSWRNEPATRKQLRYISALENPETSVKEANIIAEGMMGNFTKQEACDKIDLLLSLNLTEKPVKKKKPVKKVSTAKPVVFTPEKVEELLPLEVEELLYSPESVEFTREEDFDLLCNFYELSIDEARNRFNKNYSAIAGRLETLFDSTHHADIELLMEAAELVSSRKKEEDRIRNMGYWKRRKLRKQAKKVAKLERKLNKMRGE